MFAPRGWFQGRGNRAAYRTIAQSPLFSTKWYRSHNLSGIHALADPLWHYINRGWVRGLDPSPSFDTEFYRSWNADVSQAGINPLDHYLTYGRSEGRPPIQPLADWFPRETEIIRPIRFYTSSSVQPERLTLVLDAASPRVWNGDIVLLLLLAAWAAAGSTRTLRVLVRGADLEVPDVPTSLFHWPDGVSKPEIQRVPSERDYSDIEKREGEIFIASSWSTAVSLHNSLGGKNLAYMVLDDEADALAQGEARALALSALQLEGVTYLATTAALEKTIRVASPSAIILTSPHDIDLTSFTRVKAPKAGKHIVVWGGPSPDSSRLKLVLQGLEHAIQRGDVDPEKTPIVLAGNQADRLLLLGTHHAVALSPSTAEQELALCAESALTIALAGSAREHPAAIATRKWGHPAVSGSDVDPTATATATATNVADEIAAVLGKTHKNLRPPEDTDAQSAIEEFSRRCGTLFSP